MEEQEVFSLFFLLISQKSLGPVDIPSKSHKTHCCRDPGFNVGFASWCFELHHATLFEPFVYVTETAMSPFPVTQWVVVVLLRTLLLAPCLC